MFRRALAVTGATAFAAVALATPAYAQEFCNTTTGGPFDGTVVCVVTDTVITGYTLVPYSVGEICVAGVCSEPQSGTVRVPSQIDSDPVHAYGTLCVPGYKGQRICVDFDTRIFSIGGLPPLQ